MDYGLYDYQREAVDKLRSGSILCGGVGSGKSRTSLAYFVDKECEGIEETKGEKKLKKKKDLYIITTAKKRDSGEWEKDMEPFFLSVTESSSLTSVTIDSWNNVEKYKKIKDSFFIFDEQRVVGYGKWARSFIEISKHNRWILLTATPGDDWEDYISVFVANGFYKNKSDFLFKHAVFDRRTKYPKIKFFVREDILNEYREELLVDMDYEKRVPHFHHIEYVNYDVDNYRIALNKRWNVFKDQPINDAGELCYVLRRVVNESTDRLIHLHECYKEHKKIIVFYNFDYELEMMRQYLSNMKIVFSEYNGHKHEKIPEGDGWLYLVQYTAGCEGWNCIETNTMVFFSQTYSYKAQKQAEGRIDRLNTPFSELNYYHFMSMSSIDLAISKALKKKKNFNERDFVDEKEYFQI